MRSSLAALFVIALAACQPAAGDPASGTSGGEDAPEAQTSASSSEDVSADNEPAPAAETPASLVGEYRVAGIDGTEVGGGIGIGLSITESEIYYEPRCAGFDWSYTYGDGELSTERPGTPGPRLTAGPQAPVCEVAVHPEKQRLATALDAVTRAERTPSNGIELSGGGHSVTLYSQ